MTTLLAVRPGTMRSTRWIWAVALSVLAGVAIWTARLHPTVADIEYDWLSAYGGLHSSAYLPPEEIAADIGEEVTVLLPSGATGAANPRTPGAVLIDLPLLLAPFDSIYAIWFGLNVGMAVLLVGAWPTIGVRRSWIWGMTAAVSMPMISTLYFGGQATFVALLVLGAWLAAEGDQDLLAGLMLAAAVCLKVWPAVFLVAWLVHRRRRAVMYGLAGIAGLTLAGLALPGVDLVSALEALGNGAGTWIGLGANASLPALLSMAGVPALMATAAAAAAIGLGFWWLHRTYPRSLASPWPWLIGGLLIVPLSWASYDVILLPLAIALAISADARLHLAGLGALLAWILLPGLHLIYGVEMHTGWLELAVRVVLMSGALRMAVLRGDSSPMPSRSMEARSSVG